MKILSRLLEKNGELISWSALFMVITMLIIVILRYGFNIGWIALQESVTYWHSLLFMLGASYTLNHDGHVRVDIFYRKFSDRLQNKINLFGHVFLLIPLIVALVWTGFPYVVSSWKIFEGSREAGGLPLVFVLKTLLLIMPLLLFLQMFLEIIHIIKRISRD